MLVIARCPFNDAKANALRTTGDRFECDDERARYLAALNLVAVAKEQPVKKAAPKKTAKKKTE